MCRRGRTPAPTLPGPVRIPAGGDEAGQRIAASQLLQLVLGRRKPASDAFAAARQAQVEQASQQRPGQQRQHQRVGLDRQKAVCGCPPHGQHIDGRVAGLSLSRDKSALA